MMLSGRPDWLALVQEEIIDPDREIVDPHHHLWRHPGDIYELAELWADTQSGHNVTQTVYLQAGSQYFADGPEHLRCVGETVYVAGIADQAAQDPSKAQIAAIIAQAELAHPALDDILEAHKAASGGRFRGIRRSGARDPHPEALTIAGTAPEGIYHDPDFIGGVRRLGALGLSYDTWHYHHQNRDFLELARAAPDTVMVLDHFGTPLGVGPYADKREEIFDAWKDDIAAIAACPNVHAKLGGLAMPDNGFGWHLRPTPPTSDEFVAAQARYFHHTIECFGPDRCMFESNFPVDRWSISYHVMWNGMKKIAARYTDAEQDRMFSGTARQVYRI